VFAGVDLLGGTAVLDVKPWVDCFDTPFGADPVCGWFDEVEMLDGATPASLARRDDDAPDADVGRFSGEPIA
jgi:tRNA (Thr-GGU) A37 N-methylase